MIPCYNQGKYLEEAIESVFGQTFQDLEIIVVNDGSTDAFTNHLLRTYRRPKTRVLYTPNQGVSAARNAAIRVAQGEYIFPLDADDRIAKEYLEQAVGVLNADSSVGIVYSQADFFGGTTGAWDLPEYRFPDILIRNCIPVSGAFRRSDWEKVGGYKAEMSKGLEDWEFWLSLIETGLGVHRLPGVFLHYRKTAHSRSELADKGGFEMSMEVVRFHPKLYAENMEVVFKNWARTHWDRRNTRRLVHTKLGKDLWLTVFLERHK